MPKMEKMGNITKNVSSVMLYMLWSISSLGQTSISCEEAKNNVVDDSVITSIIRQYRKVFDKRNDGLRNVPIYIFTSSYSEPLAETLDSCIIISESFLLSKADLLGFLVTQDQDLNQLQYEQLLVLLLGTFCHEMGHYVHQVMKVSLDTINNHYQQQQCREYHIDLLSGYFAAKSLWESRSKQIGDTCSVSDTDIFRIIVAVLRNNKQSMNNALHCILRFTNAYQHASILEGSKDTLSHGYPSSRKRAFDAGIYYALIDGIARGEIHNENIRRSIDAYLRSQNKTFEQIKSEFATNIMSFLKEQRGIDNLNTDVKEYPLSVLINEGLKFVLSLPYAIPGNK